jgi:PHP family Zn ribbon phosphoesterase
VLHRVEELADRPEGYLPAGAPGVTHLIQLHEILGEINGVGPKSKTVDEKLAALVAELGPELAILREVPVEEIARARRRAARRGHRPAAPRPGAAHPRL